MTGSAGVETKSGGANGVQQETLVEVSVDGQISSEGTIEMTHAKKEGGERLAIQKTYKLYINGKFPRTESGRYYVLRDLDGEIIANMCRASRKDLRESVVAARTAFSGWASRTAYNRGQILYRIAEMLEARREQFSAELLKQGLSSEEAVAEVSKAVDCFVYYAGWADKFQQVFSAVNPVQSSHFSFSIPEPAGVVALLAPEESPLFGLVAGIAPAIVGGNSCVVLASASRPLTAVTFAEVLQTADVPTGVVNILTGLRSELLSHFSGHMDINSLVVYDLQGEALVECERLAAENVKRVVRRKGGELADTTESPYSIIDTQEIKTTWHPVGL